MGTHDLKVLTVGQDYNPTRGHGGRRCCLTSRTGATAVSTAVSVNNRGSSVLLQQTPPDLPPATAIK